MKRTFILSIFVIAAVVAGSWFVNNASAQKAESASQQMSPLASPVRVDDITYATGQLTDATGGANVSGGNWVTNTGTGNFIQVSAGSLSYTGYPSSGIGNKIDIISTAASAEDTFRNFQTQTAGTTYAAFMVNVANTTGLAANSSTTGDYFAGFINSTSTTLFADRVTIRAGSVANTYQLGFRATGNAANVQTFSTTDLPVGTTALVVISYQIVAGSANDICNIWVNPTITSPEPAPTLTQVSAADNPDVGRFFIRQGNAGTPNASIDGLRVGTSWASLISAFSSPAPVDFNNDGKTDYSVVRNTGGGSGGAITWYNQINGGSVSASIWGISTDRFLPGDFDGDGKADIAVWRAGNPGTWYVLRSSDNTAEVNSFGQTGDDPTMFGDYDGDGKDDLAVYRGGAIAGDASHWWYRRSSVGGSGCSTAGACNNITWGQNGDFPVPGDFDGDGKNDFVVQRNDGGGGARFYTLTSTGVVSTIRFGTPTDLVVPGDYNGDGKTDITCVRGVGGLLHWYIMTDAVTGAYTDTAFGSSATDFPTPGDYDGDGKSDISVWRPTVTEGTFYTLGSTAGTMGVVWGSNGDFPVARYNAH